MNSSTQAEILALGERWAEAEQHADTATLDELAAGDFRLVSPFGFVLDKAQWLDRYRSGALATNSLVWDAVAVRVFGDTAISTPAHTQQATQQGQPGDGRCRLTQVFVRDGSR